MFYKIKMVKPLKNYILEIIFQNGAIKYYDLSSLLKKWDVFKQLITEKGLFNQVKVDKGGYGISWNDEIDISCNELWENGIEDIK